jgi:hypothetical protein
VAVRCAGTPETTGGALGLWSGRGASGRLVALERQVEESMVRKTAVWSVRVLRVGEPRESTGGTAAGGDGREGTVLAGALEVSAQ